MSILLQKENLYIIPIKLQDAFTNCATSVRPAECLVQTKETNIICKGEALLLSSYGSEVSMRFFISANVFTSLPQSQQSIPMALAPALSAS